MGNKINKAKKKPKESKAQRKQRYREIMKKCHLKRLIAKGIVEQNGEASAQIEMPMEDEYAPIELKIEPQDDSTYTIVIKDPLSDNTLEGSYRELFQTGQSGQQPGADPVLEPAENPGDCSEGGDGDGKLVIDEDEPPPKKTRQPKKPVLDISYYKKELARYKKEVMEQITEIQRQQKEIKAKGETIKRLNKSKNTLREKMAEIRKENLDLKWELDKASCKITKLKRQMERESETTDSLEVSNEMVPTENVTIKIEKKQIYKDADIEMSELAKQIDEQNLAIQIINSINDNLMELAAQINKELALESKECASQLLSFVNTQLTKLETQIRKQEMALATQKERKELAMATQSILMDSLDRQESFLEISDVEINLPGSLSHPSVVPVVSSAETVSSPGSANRLTDSMD